MSNQSKMDKINQMKDDIIENYDRLDLDTELTFTCDPSVSCFGACCRDINIFLTPYDILRLKNRLDISSEDFIAKYALSPPQSEGNPIPVIVLRMSDTEEKTCQFLSDKGCTVYEDRPWACRMYPLGVASQKTESNPDGEEFYYLIKDDKCKGHGIGQCIKIKDYLDGQVVQKHDEMNELFKEITINPYFYTLQTPPPQQIQMFYMAAYNLDMFRRFLLDSRFFEIMEMDSIDEIKTKITNDDEELLKFGFEWLKYSIFGKTDFMHVKQEHMDDKKRQYANEKERQIKEAKEKEAKEKDAQKN